ncbi:MAG: FkbM family methyltransferase [Candidatus Micrarchaeia archaeon]
MSYKKFYKKILLPVIGKTYLQPFFERLHLISLAGMNIGMGSHIQQSGELQALKYVKSKLLTIKEDKVIFDVGANVGNYARYIIKILSGLNFRLYCFEPLPEAYLQLTKSLSPYMHTNNIYIYNFGFSDTKGKAIIHYNNNNLGLASLYQRRLEHYGDVNLLKQTVEIELQTIDEFVAEENLEHIHLLKLDVEGHEYKVLMGAKRLLNEGRIKFIQFEFGGCNIDSRTYFQDFWYLLKDKYSIYRIMRNGLYPIKRYSELLEIFTTTNYFAELREELK